MAIPSFWKRPDAKQTAFSFNFSINGTKNHPKETHFHVTKLHQNRCHSKIGVALTFFRVCLLWLQKNKTKFHSFNFEQNCYWRFFEKNFKGVLYSVLKPKLIFFICLSVCALVVYHVETIELIWMKLGTIY